MVELDTKKLENFSKIIKITNLNLSRNEKITDEGIKNMVQMQNLNLRRNVNITDEGIKIWYKCKI